MTTQTAPAAADTAEKRPWYLRWAHFDVWGAWGGLLLGVLSFTPSLLPRSLLFQGLVSGVLAVIGYALGSLAHWIVNYLREKPYAPAKRSTWKAFWITAAISGVVGVALGAYWQQEVHKLVGVDPPPAISWAGIVIVTVVVFLLLLGLARGIRWIGRKVRSFLGRFIRPRAAAVIGVLAAALVLIIGVETVTTALVDGLNTAFSARDKETDEGFDQPESALRSGSPDSLVAWDELGRQGRKFTAGGPTVAQLDEFSGGGAIEPIRTYVGLRSADSAEERAQLALDELVRAGGFSRDVLVVATTTGTGWLDPNGVDALEYVHNGNSAIVGLQYSYLPSWISFLVDQAKAKESGRLLFDAVYGKWASLPADSRPELLVFGESLGSFGGEAAFSGLEDIRNRTNGVVWAGPPNSNTLWRQWTDAREEGSPEIRPVYRAGEVVRWSLNEAQATEDSGWPRPRAMYLQHASDPIVWWSPDLLLTRPDWLSEPRGEDVSDRVVWMPLVTFFQVSADMAIGTTVPGGHGHSYAGEFAGAWATVSAPESWEDADTERLAELLNNR